MPDVTVDHLYPYPVGSDRPLIPKDMKALADRMEVVETNQDAVLAGVESATAILMDFTNPAVGMPSTPANGDRVIAKVGLGLMWGFIWDEDDQVWGCTGGSPLTATVFTTEPRSANTYSNLTTSGPQLVLPAGMGTIHGDVRVGADMAASADGQAAWMSYAVNGDAATDGRGVQQNNGALAHVSWVRRVALSSEDILLAKYRGSGTGSANFGDRNLQFLPVYLEP